MQLLLTLRNAEEFGLAEASRPLLRTGSLSIGRGRQADWTLPDPTRMLSAVHCEIKSENGRFSVTDLSKNGTRLNGEIMIRMAASPLTEGDEIEIGPFLILVGRKRTGAADQDQKTVVLKQNPGPQRAPGLSGDRTVIAGLSGGSIETAAAAILPRQYKQPFHTPSRQPVTSRSSAARSASRRFVDAFCEGAALDPDTLAGRTDAEFAQELGAVMRTLVTGIHDLSDSIGELRAVIGSERPGGAGLSGHGRTLSNAAAKRKRSDRLLAAHFDKADADAGTGGEALAGLVGDALRHDRAVFQAMQTALFRLLNDLSPTSIERETRTGVIRSKSSQNWDAYLRRWDSLNTGGEDGMLDVFLRYFREAYDAEMQEN